MRHLSTTRESLQPPVRARDIAGPRTPIATTALIEQARTVIARTGCTLLLIERTVRATGVAIRVDAIAADGTRSKGIARSGDPAMRALCQAAGAVLGRLAERGAPVGLMTDGTGAVFSPDRPSVVGDDWLGAVLTGSSASVDLAPFDPRGRWARLAAPHHDGTAH